jgi:hypothetical protein
MKAFFQCPSGKYSFSRLAAAVCLFCGVVVPCLVWLGCCVSKREMIEVPMSVITFTSTVVVPTLTYLYAAKRSE